MRALLVDETPGFVAKDGTDRLVRTYGPTIGVPNIATMYGLLQNGGAPGLLAPPPAETGAAPAVVVNNDATVIVAEGSTTA